MVPTSAARQGSTLCVDVVSDLSPKTTPTAPLMFPQKCFLSSPAQHGLGRTSLKSASDDSALQAIVSAISYRLERLSLSDEAVPEPPTRTVGGLVYNATSTATNSTPSKTFTRPRMLNIKPKIFERVSKSLKAGIRKSISKRRDLKKPQTPIPAPPVSQWSPLQDALLGQRVDTLGGLPASDAPEVNPYSQDTRFQELITFAARNGPAQQDANRTVLRPQSCNPPPTPTLSDEIADVAMDEDEQQPLSTRPASPAPMDLEPPSPSNDASPVPESGRAPLEASANRDALCAQPLGLGDRPSVWVEFVLDLGRGQAARAEVGRAGTLVTPRLSGTAGTGVQRKPGAGKESTVSPWTITCRAVHSDAHAFVPEPTDITMSDEEQTSRDSEGDSQMEPTDTEISETASIETGSSTLFSEEVNRGDPEHQANTRPLEQPISPSRHSPPGTTASLASPQEQPSSLQPPATSHPSKASELSPAVRSDANPQAASAQRQVPPVETTKPTPATNADATSTSTATEQVAVPSTTTTTSTAGSLTPTPTSPQTNPIKAQEQTPSAHASRVHQILGKMGLSKQASKSTKPSISDKASEDAEAEAFLAKYKSVPHRALSKSQAKPAPPSLEPTQTKGNASRSLMDDIMAGFGRPKISKSSQKEVAAAPHPTTQPPPPAPNTFSTSAAVPSTHHRSLPAVAGRQTGPKLTPPPSVVGTSRYVEASPSGRAPATVPTTGKVPSTPTAVFSTQQGSIPLVSGRQTVPKLPLPSSVVGSGRQAAASPSSGAPSTVSATGKVNGPSGTISTQAGNPSEDGPQGPTDETSDAAMHGVESNRRAVKGSRRVARAMARMGLTWQTVQQKAQETRAALQMAQMDAAASTTTSSLERDFEELRSREWHAAQPPPPPEAIPYINIDEEPYEGDEDDDFAVIEWILRRED